MQVFDRKGESPNSWRSFGRKFDSGPSAHKEFCCIASRSSPRLSARATRPARVVLSLAQGRGPVGSALQARGHFMFDWDLDLGGSWDFDRADPQRLVRGWLAAGVLSRICSYSPAAEDGSPGRAIRMITVAASFF